MTIPGAGEMPDVPGDPFDVDDESVTWRDIGTGVVLVGLVFVAVFLAG